MIRTVMTINGRLFSLPHTSLYVSFLKESNLKKVDICKDLTILLLLEVEDAMLFIQDTSAQHLSVQYCSAPLVTETQCVFKPFLI